MSQEHTQLTAALSDYLRTISLREPPVLTALREEASTYPPNLASMHIGAEQAQLIAFLVKLAGCRKALEIGVFTGYSSTVVALALPEDGRLVACDASEEYTARARQVWAAAGVAHKIQLRLGPALETLDALLASGEQDTFDFAFIDADKANYRNYYERCLKLVRAGGVIAIDNVLWKGRVVDAASTDRDTEAIRSFNSYVYRDGRVDLSVVPIGDGLTLVRRIR